MSIPTNNVIIHFTIPAATAAGWGTAYSLANDALVRQGKPAISFEEWIVMVIARESSQIREKAGF